jgi:hypothetical protein
MYVIVLCLPDVELTDAFVMSASSQDVCDCFVSLPNIGLRLLQCLHLLREYATVLHALPNVKLTGAFIILSTFADCR